MSPELSRRAALVMPFALAACTKGGGLSSACPGRAIGEVPMVPVGASWMVPVKINGADWAMALYTGSNRNLISADAAVILGLKPYGRSGSEGGVSHLGSGQLAEIDRFAFAGVEVRGIVVPVTDLRIPHFDLLPVAGLLSMSSLWVFDIQLDFPGRTLRLYNRADCDDPKPDWAEPFTQVKMHTVSSGRGSKPEIDSLSAKDRPSGQSPPDVAQMLTEVTVNGHAFTALIDTGASRSVLNADAAALAGMGTGGEPSQATDALGNVLDIASIPGNSVRVGTMTWADVRLDVTAGRLQYGVDMLFGQELMRDRRIWAMLGAKRLFLQRA